MNKINIQSEKGFTIIEVLVGAFVFMLGFSVLIFMLSRLMVNYSVNEISTANRIAKNHLEVTIAERDTVSFSTCEVVNNIKYRITKNVSCYNHIASVNIEVKRKTKDKVLCRLAYEFGISED